jgi:tRNA(Ile)-lysidine synthase
MQPDDFETKLAGLWPIADWVDVTVLVAVSGGADSVALLRGLHGLRQVWNDSGRKTEGRLIVAHVNHRLRGDESDGDAEFVTKLASQLQLPCEIILANELSKDSAGDGLEAAARKVRYRLLEQTAGYYGARYIVTAHTADDQAETVLHRIIRGSGLRGLTGMARARPFDCATLLRPLLSVRRAELIAYLASLRQHFRSDSSNNSLAFTRNRIRRKVIPLIEETINAGFVDALRRLATLAGEAQAVVDEQVEAAFECAVSLQDFENVRIDITALAGLHRHVVRELFAMVWRRQAWPLQAMGYEEWELLAAMAMEGRPSSATLPGAVVATVEMPGLLLCIRHTPCAV